VNRSIDLKGRLMMMRTIRVRLLLISVAFVILVLARTDGWSRFSLPQLKGESKVTDQDHKVLREFFSRYDRDRARKPLDSRVQALLVQTFPEVLKKGCTEVVNQWAVSSGAAPLVTMKVLFAEGKGDETPIRVLLAYSCSAKGPQGIGGFRDERLIGLIINRDFSTLVTMAQEPDCESCRDLVYLAVEKQVRIAGQTLIGINFTKSNENAPQLGSRDVVHEEKIYFFLLDEDGGLKPAGFVVKKVEERITDESEHDVTTIYDAGIVFKKDFKGNITGILSPYTVKSSNGRTEKGMVRFLWDVKTKEFVKE
jgi:hypothetical protein